MDRKQKRKLKQDTKIVAVCGAVIYLSTGVVAFNNYSARGELPEAVESPAPTHEIAQTMYSARMTGEVLVTEPEYLFNAMSQDWGTKQIVGFKEYEIPKEYAREGGSFPLEIQQYTYIICGNYGVDYELILAMVEIGSAYCSNAISECGAVGYMQVVEKWHKDRMERLNVDDLSNSYSNIIVGVDYMAELLEQYPEEVALGIYNMGYKAVDFWNDGKIITSYAEKVLSRRMEIFMEDMAE